MKKDPYVFIDHIRTSIVAIENYTRGLTKEQFLNTPQIQDALCRRLEIIGEAANKLESEFKEQFPNIPCPARSACHVQFFAGDEQSEFNRGAPNEQNDLNLSN